MGGIIFLVILIPVVFLILLVLILSRLSEQRGLLEALDRKFQTLRRELSQANSLVPEAEEKLSEAEPGIVAEPVVIKPVEEITTQKVESQEIIPEATPHEKVKESTPLFTGKLTENPTFEPAIDEKVTKRKDIEKFIGENLANKIGIAVLVLGIAFFVKYAIDKNWIRESGRVITGLVSGAVLILLAHYFRNRYRSFSSVLVGGGLTVFFVSIAFAFHQYHLIGQTVAFLAMVAVSIFAVLLSVFYDRQELAILATIGGFVTPFLVGSSQSDHVSLFTYLCILNGGLTTLSWFKRWPAINSISLFFTTIIFGGWLFNWSYHNTPGSFPHQYAFLFSTLFYVLFMIMNIINVIRLRERFIAFDFLILLSVNFLYYIAGTIILELTDQATLKGLFTLSLGLFNLVLFYVFERKRSADRGFVALLLGLALSLISLSIPVQLKGQYIAMTWFAEAVILLFVYQRSKIPLLKIASLAILACTFVDLLIVWIEVYFSEPQIIQVFFNKGAITGTVIAAGLLLYYWLLGKEKDQFFLPEIDIDDLKRLVRIFFISLLFITGALEIFHQFDTRFTETVMYVPFLQLYTFLFFSCFLWYYRNSTKKLYWQVILTTIATAFYLFTAIATNSVSEWLLLHPDLGALFIAHWLAAFLLFGLLMKLVIDVYREYRNTGIERHPVLTWLNSAALVILLSVELYQFMLWINPNDELNREIWQQQFYKAGLSILWSISSFIFIWIGIRKHFRTLRLIGLSLFTLTLLKLFLFDIRTMQPGGKIAAFILLGCLLLTVSFMYQRLKRMIDQGLPDENSQL